MNNGEHFSMRQSKQTHSDEGHRERWLISYADLLTLLFALFVVLYASADQKRARAVAASLAAQFGEADRSGQGVLPDARSNADAQARIARAVAQNDALKSRARVQSTERGLIISLAEAGFFAPGEANLREDALPLIDALADALRDEAAPLRIEGHTDSTPISNARFASNWDLSAARASAVLARLAARGLPAQRLSVAGFADQRPVADNSTEEGRAQNRRVDVVVLKSAQ
jgi:chemotaxis protein MotB